MTTSKIEWTESTWNPVTGCTKISEGCKHCYAERMAYRLKAMGQANYRRGFSVTEHDHVLGLPLKWKKPMIVFVNSMSDLFYDKVSEEFILKVFDVMRRAYWHTFQVLTKRSSRLRKLNNRIDWPDNVWMGVTVESDKYLHRIDDLRATDAKIKFLSIEPLLGQMDGLNLNGIDWVIVGGESGPGARTMDKNWVRNIRDICLHKSVPFFFKQWGGVNKKKSGRLLDRKMWEQQPQLVVRTPQRPLFGMKDKNFTVEAVV